MFEALGRIGFGLFGLAVLIGIVWLFSNNRRAVDWKLVATGLVLQIAFAAVVLLVPGGREVFDWLSHGFVRIRPAGELLTGQPQGLLVIVERPGVLTRVEVAIATQGLHLPVRHAVVRVGGADPSLHPGYRHDSAT